MHLKIACYYKNCLKVGHWFLKDVKLNNKDYSEKAGIIKRKYIVENIDSEDITRKEKKFELLLRKKNQINYKFFLIKKSRIPNLNINKNINIIIN